MSAVGEKTLKTSEKTVHSVDSIASSFLGVGEAVKELEERTDAIASIVSMIEVARVRGVTSASTCSFGGRWKPSFGFRCDRDDFDVHTLCKSVIIGVEWFRDQDFVSGVAHGHERERSASLRRW